MAFFTKSEARAAAGRVRGFRSNSAVLKESMESYKETERFDIFLSHSSDDSELVLGVKTLLEEEGLKVYVDWIVDSQLDRAAVNKETAAILRSRMKASSSMIYMATNNSTNSKWMPWELGFFDGYKPGQVAVLPLLDHENDSFNGQEYLGLYPVVTKNTKDRVTYHFVEDRGSKWSNFSKFASGAPEWKKY